jgi:hypothetical protein
MLNFAQHSDAEVSILSENELSLWLESTNPKRELMVYIDPEHGGATFFTVVMRGLNS